MTPRNKTTSLVVATLIGAIYAFIGISLAWPASHPRAWRLAAWAVSAAIYAGHLCYERFRLRHSHGRAGLHVALAAAVGAFGLAVAANIHAHQIDSPSQHRTLLLASLALWPLITAVPAFCIAVVTSWFLSLICRSRISPSPAPTSST